MLLLFVVLHAAAALQVCAPGSSCYNSTIAIDNQGVVSRPAVVFLASSASDVQQALLKSRGLPLSVRSGGHSAAGYCLSSGAVLDVRGLNSTHYDAARNTLRVGVGLTWKQVYDVMEDIDPSGSTVFPGGLCAGVSPSGYLQGGGVSVVSRSLGLGSDNVLNVTLVMADGTIRTLGRDSGSPSDQDLFWALQGGGGGNFGVVISYTLRLRSTRPLSDGLLHWGNVCWDVDDYVASVSPVFNHVALSTPNNLAMYGAFWEKNQTGCFLWVYMGLLEDARMLMSSLASPELPDPVSNTTGSGTYFEFERANNGHTEFSGSGAYIISGITNTNGFPQQAVQDAWEWLNKKPACSSWICVWPQLGGAISLPTATDTAFPWRNGTFAFEVKALYPLGDESCKQETISWARAMRTALTPYFVGSYINYIDPHVALEEYYGENLPRLQQIKKDVDPSGVFSFPKGIR